MKRFIYLDTNELNSYIAQIYNGLTTSKEEQKEENKEKSSEVNTQLGVKTNATGGLKGFLSFQGDIETGISAKINDLKTQTIKDIETKVIHDEAFDKFVNYIEDNNLIVDKDYKVGDFIKHKSSFEVFDLNFFTDWFAKDGFVDFLKNNNEKELRKQAKEEIDKLSNSKAKNIKNSPQSIEKIIKEQIREVEQQYDDIEEIINALKSLLPYEKIIMSDDFFIATSDEFFRDKPEMIGFKYGGEISFVGYITNKVTYDDNNQVPNDIPLSSIKNIANKAILNVLGNGKDINIVHPIAIYYE